MNKGMRVFNEEGEIIAVFYSVERKGDKLVVDGKALDVMRMDMIFKLEEILHGMKMIFSWSVISYILLLPYFCIRRAISKPAATAKESDR